MTKKTQIQQASASTKSLKVYKVYEYAGCSTCKKALKFLDQHKIPYQKLPIVEQPPSVSELKKMAGYLNGTFRKLFNTSGQLYREMKLGEKVATMTLDEAVKLLAAHGKLIKRPFILSDKNGTVGFSESALYSVLIYTRKKSSET